ncbi:uncharacterized protein LOC128730302 [Anopheles nili]|uniref:uncharacterized protein LOC128730302 n=1 Tax=Anopheles nili TaxID=185578 RepID=UPI00237BEE3B|nr:uncharacterized protein LOC128730302 [Anopheles nili]
MKMFPGTLISRLKQMLTGGGSEGNDPPVEETVHHGNPLLTSAKTSIQQNGAYGFTSSASSARRLSDITDMPRANHVYGSHNAVPLGGMHRTLTNNNSSIASRRFDVESRPIPVKRSSNGPPNLIPIKYASSKPSVTGRPRFGNGSNLFAGSSSMYKQSNENVPTLVPLPGGHTNPGNSVPELTSEFRNLLRSKYSTSSVTTDHVSALDRDLLLQNEARLKYEALMKKFIPIANDPPVRGAYDRFTQRKLNGDIQRPGAHKAATAETIYLTEDDDDDDDDGDDCVEVVSDNKPSRLFTTIDPAHFGLQDEPPEESAKNASELPPTEIVNTLKERFQTKQVFRDNIIQDVQQRYGALFSQRKSLIEQEKERLSSLRKNTQEKENEMRNKMLNYVCSFYTFDVLDETELKESTPEPEDVPLPTLTKDQLELMHRKLRTGNQVVMEKFNLPITGNDLVTLQGMNWLNDAVINFYMELLRERSEMKRDQGLPKVYTMNTFFLQRLLQTGYSGVRRWTRKVDLLAHDMIVVPVHVGGIHWCMSTIDLRKKTIHYYDSMGAPNNEVLNALESYLCEESLDKRKAPFDMNGLTKQNIRECPRQKNGSDCGVFSCMFAEYLTRDHAITFDQSNMEYFRQKMTVEIMLGKLLT